MEECAKLISTIGFPIAVSVFLLCRVERAIYALRDQVEDLRDEVREVHKP